MNKADELPKICRRSRTPPPLCLIRQRANPNLLLVTSFSLDPKPTGIFPLDPKIARSYSVNEHLRIYLSLRICSFLYSLVAVLIL